MSEKHGHGPHRESVLTVPGRPRSNLYYMWKASPWRTLILLPAPAAVCCGLVAWGVAHWHSLATMATATVVLLSVFAFAFDGPAGQLGSEAKALRDLTEKGKGR